MRGVRTGVALDNANLNPSLPAETLEGAGGVVNFEIPSDLAADRYQGTLRLPIVLGADAVQTPFTLDVKHTP